MTALIKQAAEQVEALGAWLEGRSDEELAETSRETRLRVVDERHAVALVLAQLDVELTRLDREIRRSDSHS